jgi:integrase
VARSNFSLTFHRAVQACDLPPVRVHELRHTGATLAAATGASTAELMRRFGHSSPAAALVYQHPAVDRDQEIARMLNALASGGDVVPIGHRLNRPADPSSGTKRHG